MYSTHNEGKSFVSERFIRTLKNQIYKHITAVSKNKYIDKLDDIVNEYNNAYHSKIKINLIEVKDKTYFDFIKENNNKHLRFRIEKVIKRKGNKLYVKWEGYDNFNSWIDEKKT